jgi:hypothetical protein
MGAIFVPRMTDIQSGYRTIQTHMAAIFVPRMTDNRFGYRMKEKNGKMAKWRPSLFLE